MANKHIVANLMAKTADGDEEIAALLAMCVGRIILKGLNSGDTEMPDHETMRHIADWISASVATNAQWLENRDFHGRPKKLMKFSTIDQVTAEANKAMRIANQRLGAVAFVGDDEELAHDLEDGYSIVKLLQPSALDRESAAMQHCIGNGAYDRRLMDGRWTYLSLRDPAGKPHATMEIDNATNNVQQLQGKQNRPPLRHYIEILKPFLERRYKLSIPTRMLGYAVDKHGNWHDIHTLPNGMKFEGTLDLNMMELSHLPDGLIVTENLIANHSTLPQLPRGLKVRGNLEMRHSNVDHSGDLITVNGFMDLTGSTISSLADGLTVGGSLGLRQTGIRTLPKRLSVGNVLDISSTHVSEIPEDASIRKLLMIYNTEVNTLPDTLDDDLEVYRSTAPSLWSFRAPKSECRAADMKIRPKPQGALQRLFGFS